MIRRFWLSFLLLIGCSSPSSHVHRFPRFPPELAGIFDHGVDLIENPSALQGQWKSDWFHELRTRVESADRIVLLSVHTIRTDTDPNRRTTYRIVATVLEELHGTVGEDDVLLSVSDSDRGYAGVRLSQSRILNQRFIGFIRRFTDRGILGQHWHLSLATTPVLDETLRVLRGRA
ncbi:MAG: hypothetical protein AAF550_13990, partial [Myxococcota bacterium]